jgi:transcriptional regulator with XRE-family HTH domain
MTSAGLPRAADLSRATGIPETLISRWLRGLAVPTVESLRLLVDAIHVELLELMVVAGHLSAVEARLEEDPTPPGPPPSIEDQILAMPHMSDDKKEALIALLQVLRAENDDNRGERQRREA